MDKLNQVLHTTNGVKFLRVPAEEVKEIGNFVTNMRDTIVCIVDGKEVETPKFFINEVGVKYRVILSEKELYDYEKKLAKVGGIRYCKKSGLARIRVWFNVTAGQRVESVLNGFTEADGKVMEDGVQVQDIANGEKWVMEKTYLNDNYIFIEHDEETGTDIYEAKGVVTAWVYCDENIMYPKWGGIDMYATPMLKLDEKDPYGVNYARFWGDDSKLGTYIEVGIITSCGTKFYDSPWALPVGIREAKFEPPKFMVEQVV